MYMNNILVDNRVGEALSVLTTVMSKANDLDDSYIVIYPNNHFYCISGETVIWHSILINSIPDMNTVYIDTKSTLEIQAIPKEFDEEGKVKSYLYTSSHYIPMDDIFLKNTIDRNLNMYIDHGYEVILYKEGFTDSEEFDPFRGLKADDGAKMYKDITDDNKLVMFPMFTGFPKLSKSDSMNLTVYKQDDKYNLVKFDIFKKKMKRNIEVLFRVMNLDR